MGDRIQVAMKNGEKQNPSMVERKPKFLARPNLLLLRSAIMRRTVQECVPGAGEGGVHVP
jgi:hypothetical protein